MMPKAANGGRTHGEQLNHALETEENKSHQNKLRF